MHIVVTGASKGIGRAIVEKFASGGAQHQFYLCSRDEAQLHELRIFLEDKYRHVSVHVKAADLGKKEEVAAFAEWVHAFHQSIDILVNNAGQFQPGSVHNEPDGLLESMMNVNLYSAYHLTRTLLPPMMQARKGHIFNMCSIASLKAYDNGGAYSISKFALAGFTKNLREEMKPFGIKVTAVYPGATMSDSWKGFDNTSLRIMEAEDIAQLVHAAAQLSMQACVEEIIVRPQLGDL